MKILLSDYIVNKSTAIGSINRKMIELFCNEHEYTVFANEFDNPNPERVQFFKLFSIRRPLILLFITHHICHFTKYWILRLKGERFDLIQGVECNIYNADITRVGFCHRAYLEKHFDKNFLSIRGVFKYLNHWIRSKLEPIIYKKVKIIVVPSKGLKNELCDYYKLDSRKIFVIENPIDHELYNNVSVKKVKDIKDEYDFSRYRKVLIFVALGHFERKGLDIIINSLMTFKKNDFLLLVIGGERDYVNKWKHKTCESGLSNIKFLGFKKDVLPYFHSADIFILPSQYETFSQVSYIAAAIGKPLITTQLYGVEEFMVNNKTGFIIKRNEIELRSSLEKLLDSDDSDLLKMGILAKSKVEKYDVNNFKHKWKQIYNL
jgi:glycosyltransferase involved in cell wall biosynthesis